MIKFNLNFQLNRFPCQPRLALVRPSPLFWLGTLVKTCELFWGLGGISELPGEGAAGYGTPLRRLAKRRKQEIRKSENQK